MTVEELTTLLEIEREYEPDAEVLIRCEVSSGNFHPVVAVKDLSRGGMVFILVDDDVDRTIPKGAWLR